MALLTESSINTSSSQHRDLLTPSQHKEEQEGADVLRDPWEEDNSEGLAEEPSKGSREKEVKKGSSSNTANL